LGEKLFYGYINLFVSHFPIHPHGAKICLKRDWGGLAYPPTHQSGHAPHSGVHTHIRFMQGHKIPDFDVTVRLCWLHQKGGLRSKIISHGLHLISGQTISVYRYRAGIASSFPGLEYNGMNCLKHKINSRFLCYIQSRLF
jgi:hypothetical protein